MLLSLHVKNLALIEEEEIEFGEGLNILTGETGAGKSIVIGSVTLALGARGDNELIRHGAEYALIELVFKISDETILDRIKSLDIPIEEDGLLYIQRKIMPNRSAFKICGENTTAKIVRDVADLLIDIHGQHEHQSLFYVKKHMEFLDEYARLELMQSKGQIEKTFLDFHKLKKELQSMTMDESTREKEYQLLEFELSEIEKAELKVNEDEELDRKYRKMLHARKIADALNQIEFLTGNQDKTGAEELIGRATRELHSVLEYDDGLQTLNETLTSIEIILADFNRSLVDYKEDMEFEESEFQQIQERLDLLNHLKLKYRMSIQEIMDYQSAVMTKLDELTNYEMILQKKKQQCEQLENELKTLCEKVSEIRKAAAKNLSVILKNALEELNFLQVDFEIQVLDGQGITSLGWDEVEFMLSTNPGEPKKPLSQVASGGELSRIMLALKTVLAQKDAINTLIFDEIDTGISGKTAWKVSEKLSVLGKSHQVICITHLPQIAAMSDIHFVIEKDAKEGLTKTRIRRIHQEDSIYEIARMLGGETITQAVLNNARDLKESAVKTKEV